ncbi:MAG: EamA family transporter [Bacteroidota bacterium]
MKNGLVSSNLVLFVIPALIWGSTWYAITFQLGNVPPIYSVSYRFLLAGLIFISYCLIRKISLKFSLKQHRWILTQAVFLFGFNYVFAYYSEQYIASGLVAIIFSTVIFLNVLFGRIFLKNPVRKQVLIGAMLGLAGTALVFQPELSKYEGGDQTSLGILLCIVAIIMASLGNITSAYNQRNKLPVIPTTAIGMMYGGILMFMLALLSGEAPSFDTRPSYIISLIYLALIGSIAAFSAYLTLIGKIGADRAAYALVVVPVIAIIISMIFENYQMSLIPALGFFLLLAGNIFALRK